MPRQSDSASKKIQLSVNSDSAEVLKKRLLVTRKVDIGARRQHVRPARAGKREVVVAPLLPAKARELFHAALAGVEMHVEVELPEPSPLRPRLISSGAAERQCRRLTWEERWLLNQLPEGASVRVQVGGSAHLNKMLAREPGGAGLQTVTTRGRGVRGRGG